MIQIKNRFTGVVIKEIETLTRADLRDANIDYSAWPLQCTSLRVIVCDKIAAQLLFHAFAVAKIQPTDEQINFMAAKFHRYAACGGVSRLTAIE